MNSIRNKYYICLIIICIITVTFLIGICPSFAISNNEYANLLTENEAIDFVSHWIKANYNSNINIKYNYQAIYYTDDTLYGYYFIFNNNIEDLGYIILNADKSSQIIIEFSLHGGGLFNIYNNKKLYYYDYLQYGYLSDEKGNGSFANKNIEFANSLKLTYASKPNIYDGINDMDLDRELSLYARHHYVKEDLEYIPNTMNFYNYGKKNCGPTALTNLALLYTCMGKNMLSGDIHSTYDKMVNCVGQEESISNLQAIDGFKKYAKTYTTFKADIFIYWWNWWSYYRDDIDRGNPVIMYIEGSAPGQENAGHLIIAYGWIEYDALVLTGNRFLIVADGWQNNSIRVLNFDHYDVKKGSRVKL